ncbi:MAG: nucleotide sugar dehydrogenase [Deltaproteobacteria bacterium]|nr:nucleotide sugar dehydrogenase [Deltaproteobacteria bacterium]
MEKIAVIGLGYVGLPVALAFARVFPGVVGFDINKVRVRELREGVDRTRETTPDELAGSSLLYTADTADLADCTFFVVTVPTPIDEAHQPDLGPVRSATRTVGRVLKPGAVVVYESTVYPGVTEDICGPILEAESGLTRSVDFHVGYSPERINPGDKEHTLSRIVKVVSGEDGPTLERVAAVYEAIISAGVHRAPSVKVAEAAKVIENTQRDINIALMNELSLIFDKVGIATLDVLTAARTKWNFLPFTPGLVGGHCIGVDPYYLTSLAESLGYHPEVILAGRRINDSMGYRVGQRVVKALVKAGRPLTGAKVGVLGLTFKENVPDLRNSRVVDIVEELRSYGIEPLFHDAQAIPEEVEHEMGFTLSPDAAFAELDAVVFAVPHREYLDGRSLDPVAVVREDGVVFDVKSALRGREMPAALTVLSL